MTARQFKDMTPLQLGETRDRQVLEHLCKFFTPGNTNRDVQLATIALIKIFTKCSLDKDDKDVANFVSVLFNAVAARQGQTKYHLLCAINVIGFELNAHEIRLLECIERDDDKPYNRNIAKRIIQKAKREEPVAETRKSHMQVWLVDQICWDYAENKGTPYRLLVEARTCQTAAALAGEADGVYEIQSIVSLGPIVAREKQIGKK